MCACDVCTEGAHVVMDKIWRLEDNTVESALSVHLHIGFRVEGKLPVVWGKYIPAQPYHQLLSNFEDHRIRECLFVCFINVRETNE